MLCTSTSRREGGRKKKKKKKAVALPPLSPPTASPRPQGLVSIQLPYRTNRLLHNHFFSCSPPSSKSLFIRFIVFFLFSFFFPPSFLFPPPFFPSTTYTTNKGNSEKKTRKNTIKSRKKERRSGLPSGFRERLPDSGSAYRAAAALGITASASLPTRGKPSNTTAQLLQSS